MWSVLALKEAWFKLWRKRKGVSEISIHYSWCLERRGIFRSMKTTLVETELGGERWCQMVGSPPSFAPWRSVDKGLMLLPHPLCPHFYKNWKWFFHFRGNERAQCKKMKPSLESGEITLPWALNLLSLHFLKLTSILLLRESASCPHGLGWRVSLLISREDPSRSLLILCKNVHNTDTLHHKILTGTWFTLNLPVFNKQPLQAPNKPCELCLWIEQPPQDWDSQQPGGLRFQQHTWLP